MEGGTVEVRRRLIRWCQKFVYKLRLVNVQDLQAQLSTLRDTLAEQQQLTAALRQELTSVRSQTLAHGEELGTLRPAIHTAQQQLVVHDEEISTGRAQASVRFQELTATLGLARGHIQDIMYALEDLRSRIVQTDLQSRQDLVHTLLRQRAALARHSVQLTHHPRLYTRPDRQDDKLFPADDAYQGGLDRLRVLYPHAYSQWYPLLSVNDSAYADLPTDSCSVAGHPIAEHFAYFVSPYLTGRVLDIGCGPQPVPSYLAHYPVELISGIDPLASEQPHPFDFVRGLAEHLPWHDGTFNAVMAATSLDHVLSPDLAFTEIMRVLAPGGVFLTWVAFIPDGKPYNPIDPDIKPIDQFHLFHFAEGWFEEIVRKRFHIVEKLAYDGESHFYALRPKAALARAA
jgi:SAM-dependent methyltransferase